MELGRARLTVPSGFCTSSSWAPFPSAQVMNVARIGCASRARFLPRDGGELAKGGDPAAAGIDWDRQGAAVVDHSLVRHLAT
jgi:hypothetical protein